LLNWRDAATRGSWRVSGGRRRSDRRGQGSGLSNRRRRVKAGSRARRLTPLELRIPEQSFCWSSLVLAPTYPIPECHLSLSEEIANSAIHSFGFAVSPISTRRRAASDRVENRCFYLAIHLCGAARRAGYVRAKASPIDAVSMKFVDDACFPRRMFPPGRCGFCWDFRTYRSLCHLQRSRWLRQCDRRGRRVRCLLSLRLPCGCRRCWFAGREAKAS
jgi:hypothetical protein